MHERVHEPAGFRHVAQAQAVSPAHTGSHHRWVINKLRALGSWYTKGLDNGSHLRTAINTAESLDELRDLVASFFLAPQLLERELSVVT